MTTAVHDNASFGKRLFAGILDFITSFALFGWLIASLTGGTTEGGFELNGGPALLLFALVVGYYVLGHYFGGTLWQRIMHTRA